MPQIIWSCRTSTVGPPGSPRLVKGPIMNYRKAIPVLLSFPTALAAALLLVVIGVDGAVPPYEAKSP